MTDLLRLLPHREPMVFVTGLEHADAASATCWFDVAEGTPFVRDGVLSELALIETCAQTASVHFHHATGVDAAAAGYLIEVRRFALHRPVRVGERITATAHQVRVIPPFGIYDVEVVDADGRPLGAGNLKFYEEAAP